MAGKDPTVSRNWYTLSEEALKAWIAVLVLSVLAVVGFFVYRRYEAYALERDAEAVMAEVRQLLGRLQGGPVGDFGDEYQTAWRGLEEAHSAFLASEYAASLDSAKRSRALLLSILDAVTHAGRGGEARVIAVHGGVEVRRERGEWEEARARTSLAAGDYIKTNAGGSAEIMFANGTLYNVRPNSMLLITPTTSPDGLPGEQAIRLEYGWVNLNTAKAGSRVATPQAEARVRQETEATVTFDQASSVSRVAAYSGGVEVATASGTREVGVLQQVTVEGDQLSAPQPLPANPQLIEPANNAEIDFSANSRLLLAWQPVESATRYALQVSRNGLFVDNVIDVENRSRPRSTLGIKGEGSFEWRVAAINREGLRGPWSDPQKFRVAAKIGATALDTTPPPLDVENVEAYGSLFIVAGRTEPGAGLVINGEPVAVAADGTFTKTVQLEADGWSFVEVTARDPAGNKTVRRRRVFVDNL